MNTHTETTPKARGRKGAKPAAMVENAAAEMGTDGTSAAFAPTLDANANGKFVLFAIKPADRVTDGPVMRGFLEIASPDDDGEPLKVNVAAWAKVGRESGSDYLSLKVANNTEEQPDVYTVGPFFGRLFKQIETRPNGDKKRYFGFIESSEKTGEDEDGRGLYVTHWQLRVNAKPAVSNDGKTHYITGTFMPAEMASETGKEDLPF